MNGGLGEATPSHATKAITALPCAEDLFDPTTNPVDRLVPGIEPRQCFSLVASPHGGSDDTRRAAFRMDGVAKMRAPIGAVGEHLPRIFGKSGRPCLAVVDIGRRDCDFLDQGGVGVSADMRLEAMNGGLALVLQPMALVVFLARRNDDRRIDKRAGRSCAIPRASRRSVLTVIAESAAFT